MNQKTETKALALFSEVYAMHHSQLYLSGDYYAKLEALAELVECEAVEATLPKEATNGR